jgi:hypothetical protein
VYGDGFTVTSFGIAGAESAGEGEGTIDNTIVYDVSFSEVIIGFKIAND